MAVDWGEGAEVGVAIAVGEGVVGVVAVGVVVGDVAVEVVCGEGVVGAVVEGWGVSPPQPMTIAATNAPSARGPLCEAFAMAQTYQQTQRISPPAPERAPLTGRPPDGVADGVG